MQGVLYVPFGSELLLLLLPDAIAALYSLNQPNVRLRSSVATLDTVTMLWGKGTGHVREDC